MIKFPKTKIYIHGVFYKMDEQYSHFIFTHIYNNDKIQDSSYNNIMNFNTKVNDFFEKKIDDQLLQCNSSVINIYSPIYKDYQYRDYNSSTHFKCKNPSNFKFYTGLTYQLMVDMYSYSFTKEESIINGWIIKIINSKEITTI